MFRCFSSAKQSELSNPNSEFHFAIIDNQPVAYLKLNFGDAQTELQDTNALEIERIYVLQQHQGLKIGKQLLEFAIQKAADNGLLYLWLGVWEHNLKAQKFYKYHGFEVFDSHQFVLGKDEQTDLLMKKLL
ncbi:GNAT family N-acetyltransferase [Mucilaginibacter litoreus]|uniref:GNAT family N-acetyltransferase n=1 Tax=Mucilaginibacter litoreus TaxID=1048221 RepID=A0ABW3ASD1_9SPHI